MDVPTTHRMSFNGGELAPELQWRTDLARYHTSCLTLENMLVTPYGGVKRRPGTKYVAKLFDTGVRGGSNWRVIPFNYSTSTYYLVVLTDERLDVYDSSGTLVAEDMDSPFTSSEVYDVAYCQSGDVMWLVHPSYAPRRLERAAATTWYLREHPMKRGPFKDVNIDRKITLSFAAQEWDSGTAYTTADYVYKPDTAVDLTNIEEIKYKRSREIVAGYDSAVDYYHTEITTDGAHGYSVGDLINFVDLAGYTSMYRIIEVGSATTFKVEAGVRYVYGETDLWVGPHYGLPGDGSSARANDALSSTEQSVLAKGGVFYECLDANSNQDPESATAYWRSMPYYEGTMTVTSSESLFAANWVGKLIKVEQRLMDPIDTQAFTTTEVGINLTVHGGVRMRTGGTWTGQLDLEVSLDHGISWEVLASIVSTTDTNEVLERDIVEEGALVRMSATVTGGTCDAVLEIIGGIYEAILEVTAYTSATVVTVTTKDVMPNLQNTWRWSEGGWAGSDGYPRAVTIHEERLVFAGSNGEPSTVWGSAVNDWEDFDVRAEVTAAFQFTIAADTLQRIRWLVSRENLILGCDSGEWTIGSRATAEVLSGANVQAKRHTEYGSAFVRPIVVDDTVIFAQRNGAKVRGLRYNFDSDGLVAHDLTVMSPHITGDGIYDLAYQRAPENVIWAIREDGELLSLTYDREQEVLGWARHTTGTGLFKSVCTTGGADQDQVWLLVERGDDVYLELLLDCEDDEYLDCRQTGANKVAGNTFSNVPVDADVQVYGDYDLWVEDTEYSLAAGVVTLETGYSADRVVLGVKFTSTLKPTRVVMGARQGAGPGSKQRLASADVYFVTSLQADISADNGANYEAIPFVEDDAVDGELPDRFTGRKRVTANSGWVDDAPYLIVRQTYPYPLHVACIGYNLVRSK